ncbi:PREDICTED: astacin-like metalloendopeptidase [Dipodomys ordii]|uniref:Metalloendopeptidase n=1 Tax=Dipodomys ordii TaxID=10020 RepID=A0A1S3FFB6_DIPOR|nr:PREDICTED: astacin-like metalloendopeptidase [Dipodomys ordii]
MGHMGGLWVLGLLFLIGSTLGAPSASPCLGACSTSVPEGLISAGSQAAVDQDIPAINQGLIPEETPDASFLMEGDIIRPNPFRLLSVTNKKWPKSAGGIVEVPFLLSSKYDEPSRQAILQAFAEFEHSTCIRFVAYQGQKDFISIIPMSGCFSGIGRSGGMQVVSLAPACLQKGHGIVLHELMHVLGFWHEHTRADRDRYIRVNWNEILPGFEINFIKSQSSNMLAPYDYSSVMHYGRLAFSWHRQPTIIPLWAPSAHIGQRWNLSASDISRVRKLYDCSPTGPDSFGNGLHVPSVGRNPNSASRPYLQRLLEALRVESGNPDLGGFGAGGQHVAEGSVESSPLQSAAKWILTGARRCSATSSPSHAPTFLRTAIEIKPSPSPPTPRHAGPLWSGCREKPPRAAGRLGSARRGSLRAERQLCASARTRRAPPSTRPGALNPTVRPGASWHDGATFLGSRVGLGPRRDNLENFSWTACGDCGMGM